SAARAPAITPFDLNFPLKQARCRAWAYFVRAVPAGRTPKEVLPMLLPRPFRKWFSSRRTPIQNRRNQKKAGTPSRARPKPEHLEERTVPVVPPQFTGPFGLSVGSLVNISRAGGNQTEGTIAVDPTNPNRVFAASNPGTSAANSTNAGSSFATFNGS